MNLTHQHPWDVTTAQARAIQEELAAAVVAVDQLPLPPQQVAGVDVGFEDGGRVTRAAVVVLTFPELALVEQRLVRQPTRFPYVPGLLSFREIPAVLAALEALDAQPDLLLCDGQGIAHPRRCGVACHLGVLTGLPAIGVAKSRLVGTHDEPGPLKGDRAPLMDGDETIGAVLRTRERVRPLYVSPGHRVSLATACELVLACTTRYRLPETTRLADRLASNRGRR